MPEIIATPNIYSSTNLYSSDALAELRQQQSFAIPMANTGAEEGLELTGDAAESIEMLTEIITSRQNPTESFITETTEIEAVRAFRTLKASQKPEPGEEDRINMALPKKILPEFLPLDVNQGGHDEDTGEDANWEQELVKRGARRPLAFPAYPQSTHAPLAREEQITSDFSSRNTSSNTMAMADIMSSLRQAVTAIADNCETAER